MKYRKLSITFLVLCILVAGGYAAFVITTPSFDSQLNDLVEQGYNGTILVAHGDKVLHEAGYGVASCDGTVANSAETVFSVGSVTKMFTAVAIGQLDDAKQLSVDDPLSKFFDDVPTDKADITVTQLIEHRSGLQTYHDQAPLGDFFPMTREEAREEIFGRKLQFTPGDEYNYSNSGYTLLALIIEAASGQTYTDYIRQNILEPAGMNNTGFWGESFSPIASAPNEVVGCSPPASWDYSWALVGSGGMVSTIGDLHRWVLALQGDELLSDAGKRRTGFALAMSLGFGSAGGSSQHEFSADVEYIAPANVIVIAISNRHTPRAEDIAPQLLQSALRDRISP